MASQSWFSIHFYKGENYSIKVFAPRKISSSTKGTFLKGKNLLSREQILRFKNSPYEKGDNISLSEWSPMGDVSIHLNLTVTPVLLTTIYDFEPICENQLDSSLILPKPVPSLS